MPADPENTVFEKELSAGYYDEPKTLYFYANGAAELVMETEDGEESIWIDALEKAELHSAIKMYYGEEYVSDEDD